MEEYVLAAFKPSVEFRCGEYAGHILEGQQREHRSRDTHHNLSLSAVLKQEEIAAQVDNVWARSSLVR